MLDLLAGEHKEGFSSLPGVLCLYVKKKLGPPEPCGPVIIVGDNWHISLML